MEFAKRWNAIVGLYRLAIARDITSEERVEFAKRWNAIVGL